MSLLEGHGDVTMDRAGAAASRARSASAACCVSDAAPVVPACKLVQRLLGLEAKLNQYEQGERFIHQSRRSGGSALLNRACEAPENLPELDEIRDPDAWIRRVVAGAVCQGLTTMATILVVDDEPDIRLLTKMNLEHDGHTIVTATDGEEALDTVRETPPDLIVLDVMMPKVDGWDVLEQLKSALDKPITEIPVIVVTALGSPMDRVKGGIEGAVQYLTKPMDAREALRAAVADALAEPEVSQRRRAAASRARDAGPHRAQCGSERCERGAEASTERARTRHADMSGRKCRQPPGSSKIASPALTDKQRQLLRAVSVAPTVMEAASRARHEPLERLRELASHQPEARHPLCPRSPRPRALRRCDDLTERGRHCCASCWTDARFRPPRTPVTCAVSGGADSMALLALATDGGL